MEVLLENLAPVDLSSSIGQAFTALTVPQPVTLTLMRVDVGSPNPGFRTPFTLTFTSDWSVMLLEAQYRLIAPDHREFLFHLVPVAGVSAQKRVYMAYFN